jgi:DNA polymerase (family X)
LKSSDVAAVLAEIAVLSELNGENPFRSRAFAGAARALEGSDIDLPRLARDDRLTSLPGIGPAIAETIRELVETGRSTLHEELRTATPIGLFALLRVPGLGPKRTHTLYTERGIESLDALETAARDGTLAALPGFGPKTTRKVLEGIAFVRAGLRRRRFPEAAVVAERLHEWLQRRADVQRAEIVGGVRRRLEVVDSIELLAATDDAAALIEDFSQLNGVELQVASGDCAEARLADGVTARLHVVLLEEWAAALVWLTGNDDHLAQLRSHAEARGLRLERRGLFRGERRIATPDETDVFRALGLPWTPPELREGKGEVELAAQGLLPRLIDYADLRGAFHCHTVYSDGKATIPELAEAARERGWSYLGLADHSRSAAYVGGLSVERVRHQQSEVDAWNRRCAGSHEAVRLFKGIESDILADGRLDYPDEVLATFDYVIGSVHGGFAMGEREMTERILRAVRNPYLTMLGHPTGRRLLTRSGYPLDVRAVLEAAAQAGVVVEVNANPHRLDLDWRHLRYALEVGVLIAINPDAHSVDSLDDVHYGINIARKGGLSASQVLNTWPLEEVEEHFAGRKARIETSA